MTYRKVRLSGRKKTCEDTYIYHLAVDGEPPYTFKPGQYVYLKNPAFSHPEESHPFSLASSPLRSQHLEFCIKTYGDWTEALEKLPLGSELSISDPQGTFTWESTILHGVILLGGIGISPFMSMLRFMVDMEIKPNTIILLYGNRTPQTVAYREELKLLQNDLPMLKIVDIYSHVPEDDPTPGYRGFITRDIIEKEVNLTLEPTFFYLGPPIFISKMDTLLDELAIPVNKRRKEDFDNPTTQ